MKKQASSCCFHREILLRAHLLWLGQAYLDAVWTERNIMAQLKSPFLLNLLHAFQSDTEVFLVMPFMQGAALVSARPVQLLS